MRRSTDFTMVVRSGRRARRGVIVFHLLAAHAEMPESARRGAAQPVVGLIVGKAVGASVVRHQVSRRLRAQLAARLRSLPAGSAAVVRALPGAGVATSAQLSADLDAALARLGMQR
jgi:ribonuclease P protein component